MWNIMKDYTEAIWSFLGWEHELEANDKTNIWKMNVSRLGLRHYCHK